MILFLASARGLGGLSLGAALTTSWHKTHVGLSVHAKKHTYI